MRQRVRILGALILVLAMTAACSRGQQSGPAGPSSQPPTSNRRPAAALQPEALKALADPSNLRAALDVIEQSPRTMPKSAFDVDAKAAELGPDVIASFTFVRDSIRLEIYEGVLRGAQGTLMAGAGDSADKSLLLGALLRHHGFEVRYLRGQLNESRANELVSQMFSAGKANRPGSSAATDTRQPWLTELRKVTFAEWIANVELVRATLAQAGVRASSEMPVTRDALVRQAADHIWVEYRDGSTWVALDPSLPSSKPGDVMGSGQEIGSEIPLALRHRIAIRVVAEERVESQINARTVLTYDTTAADLNGARVVFRHRLDNTPAGWTAEPMLEVGKRIIIGQVVAGGGLAGGTRSLGERVGGLLGQRSSPSPRGELSAEWLEVDFTSPSGETETVRREIFDRIGPAERARHQEGQVSLKPFSPPQGIPAPFGTMFALSFHGGRLHPGLPLSRLAAKLPELRQVFDLVTNQQSQTAPPSKDAATELARVTAPLTADLLDGLATSFYMRSQRSLAVAQPQGAMFYEATPRLVIAGLVPAETGSGTFTALVNLDLRRNGLRLAADTGVPAARVFWANALRGLLDGVHEHDVIRDALATTPGQVSPVSTVAVMTQARQRSIPIRAVTVATRIEDLPVAEDVKAVMRNAFGADVAYVVPSASVTVNGAERLGWWRLDLRTGETLAVLDNGLHFTVGELLLSVAIITAIAAAAVPLYYALIDYVNASIEQWPGCMGLAHWCRVYGPPPPGCTYDPVEGYISCE